MASTQYFTTGSVDSASIHCLGSTIGKHARRQQHLLRSSCHSFADDHTQAGPRGFYLMKLSCIGANSPEVPGKSLSMFTTSLTVAGMMIPTFTAYIPFPRSSTTT